MHRGDASVARRIRQHQSRANGAMTFDTLSYLMHLVNVPMPEEDLKVLFNEADKDHSGVVQFDDFMEYLFPAKFMEPALTQASRSAQASISKGASAASQGKLRGIPLLVFANKEDLLQAAGVPEKGQLRTTNELSVEGMAAFLRKAATSDELKLAFASLDATDKKNIIAALGGNGRAGRLLLVSDNLKEYQLIIDAALDEVTVVLIKFASWSLDDLKTAIVDKAAGKQFASIGIFEHGKPGELALLGQVAGGCMSLDDLCTDESLVSFFKWLAGYVQKGGRIDLLACSVAAGSGHKLISKLEDITSVNWTASTDKTGGAEGCNFIMETDAWIGNVATYYFNMDKIGQWRHSAFIFGGLGMALVVAAGTAVVSTVATRTTEHAMDKLL